ncbi:hypothetical protein L861_19805 [Litchfieldella anticariensis FP35 = DSM 16096]|uniref:site-specific DNA-methyltransferase (adenine-specific) n=1 Tax=Litchfieldella anticariensis (strain DSM 16096 / CECT 5854 / CIP 108499 / LMG 22089 / FP35) TaxID=1121939 RepID=S2L2K2_LITA3|nr:type I restriction-modification system subunit M N-terminal domain-containing protein [Halomonas anticariensis]EPC01899.1 hypothetical protein L861_19805 [Halomonas anticariensis FP35 = DSM 16096]
MTNGSPLKSALWEAANHLRGSAVDRTDWKGYILPLLFFKRISDVWDEETAEAAETFREDDPSHFPEVHRFTVPEGCQWQDVREIPTNVGAALHRAMQEIVRAVRFDSWQATHPGEREVKLALRKTLFKYKLHQDNELFERSYE